MKKIFILFTILFIALQGKSQLVVDIYPTEAFMVNKMLIGNSSVKVWNVQFGGAHDARGIFYSKNTPIPISEGILLSTGYAVSSRGPNKGTGYTGSHRSKGDLELENLAQYKTYDAAWISFEFEATQDLIRFNYVFASEEYPEYVGSTFNDVFGFFLTNLETGEVTNLAVIPNTTKPVTVNNINHLTHSNFYLENQLGVNGADSLIEFDGLTKLLIAYSSVTPGTKYRIKIAIADVGDDAFDSGVFLQGKSFTSEDKETFFNENNTYFEAFKDTNKEPVMAKITPSIPVKKVHPIKEKQPKKLATNEPYPKLDSIIVYFDFDKKTAIPSSLKNAENQIGNAKLSNYNISIIGHTDQKGSMPYNTQLSLIRSKYIAHWLRTNHIINTSVKIEGKSFKQLKNQNTSEQARSENRRVVIYFITQ